MYDIGYYPVDVTTGYNNWYTPNIKLYEYSDEYFNRYSCKMWYIELVKYDNSEIHKILLEDKSRLVIAAKCEKKENSTINISIPEDKKSILKYYSFVKVNYILELENADVPVIEYDMIENVEYFNREISILSDKKVGSYFDAVNEVKNAKDNDKFYVVTCTAPNYYHYMLVPFSTGREVFSEEFEK